jgi:outer membrane protein assembly factor BamD (BamD/ComL family)
VRISPVSFRILAAAACAVLPVLFARCAPQVAVYSYEVKLLGEADSLFQAGNYEGAKVKYAKVRDDHPQTPSGASAQYALGYTNIFFNNPFADYNAALREFKRFASTYPDDKRIDLVNNWIRLLTVLQDFGKNYYGSTHQLENLKNRQSSIFKDYSTLQDAYLRCDRAVDSLSQRIAVLEGIIAELDKIK